MNDTARRLNDYSLRKPSKTTRSRPPQDRLRGLYHLGSRRIKGRTKDSLLVYSRNRLRRRVSRLSLYQAR